MGTFKVRKKGKTVGRRSKAEAIFEALLDYQFGKPRIKKLFETRYKNALLYGTSIPPKAWKNTA
jgi:hypothetical protein